MSKSLSLDSPTMDTQVLMIFDDQLGESIR